MVVHLISNGQPLLFSEIRRSFKYFVVLLAGIPISTHSTMAHKSLQFTRPYMYPLAAHPYQTRIYNTTRHEKRSANCAHNNDYYWLLNLLSTWHCRSLKVHPSWSLAFQRIHLLSIDAFSALWHRHLLHRLDILTNGYKVKGFYWVSFSMSLMTETQHFFLRLKIGLCPILCNTFNCLLTLYERDYQKGWGSQLTNLLVTIICWPFGNLRFIDVGMIT